MAGEAMSAFVRFFVRDEVSDEVRSVEQRAERAADAMDEAADASGDRLTRGLKSAGDMAVTAAKGLAGIGASVTGAVAGMLAFTGASGETLEDLGKLETAFTTAGHSAETAGKVIDDFTGILGGENFDQAVEASNHLAEMTSSTEDLSKWGTIAAGVYARFGDSLPLEGLTEAANETAKVGTVTGPLADALNWAGISEEKFNEQLAKCNSEQERATLITNTLNGEYAEAGNKYLEMNSSLVANRKAQADWSEAMAKAGEKLMSVTTALMEVGAALMEKAMPHMESFANWFNEKLPVVQEKVVGLGDKFQWFADHFPQIATAAAGLLGAFMAFQGMTAVVGAINAMKAAYAALQGATLLAKIQQLLLNAAMKANPIILVVSLIAGLVAAFITAYTTSETFRNKVNAVFKKVKAVVTAAIGGVKGAINGALGVIGSLGDRFQAVKNRVASAVGAMRDTVKRAIDRIKSFFNITLKFSGIKLPHITVSWKTGGALAKIAEKMGLPGVPDFGVSWYAKGAIFDEPTLFATPYGFKGVGEAGPEAVAPINVLMDYVRKAVSEANGAGGYVANINVTTGETSEAKLAKLIAREEKRNAYAMGVI